MYAKIWNILKSMTLRNTKTVHSMNSFFSKFQKKQNCNDTKKISGCLGPEGQERDSFLQKDSWKFWCDRNVLYNDVGGL